MEQDLIRQMGYSTLATRLKRISDKMTHSTRLMYKQLDIDIEPNWYLVLVLVKQKPKVSVLEIADQLGFTHQSVITMTNKMIQKNYLESCKDSTDKRKTVFTLTVKAEKRLPEISAVWKVGQEAILELLNKDISIIDHLDVLESNLTEASFGERIIKKINAKK